MARSSYVYVVVPWDQRTPVKAFTVKHELKTWLHANGNTILDIYRLADGARDYTPMRYSSEDDHFWPIA